MKINILLLYIKAFKTLLCFRSKSSMGTTSDGSVSPEDMGPVHVVVVLAQGQPECTELWDEGM